MGSPLGRQEQEDGRYMSNMDANGDTHPVGIVDGDQRRIRRSLTPFWLSQTCALWMASENGDHPLPPASRQQPTQKILNFLMISRAGCSGSRPMMAGQEASVAN